MIQPQFVFDLDGTLTQKEIVPWIAQGTPMVMEIEQLTKDAMQGKISFEKSFQKRVELLKGIPICDVWSMVSQIPLNTKIIDFIQKHRECCWIVTGNLDIWIARLIQDMGMVHHTFSSIASVEKGQLKGIQKIVDKGAVVKQLQRPVIAIGDGANDVSMMAHATLGVGFGGVNPIAPALLQHTKIQIYSEEALYQFLVHFVS